MAAMCGYIGCEERHDVEQAQQHLLHVIAPTAGTTRTHASGAHRQEEQRSRAETVDANTDVPRPLERVPQAPAPELSSISWQRLPRFLRTDLAAQV